MGCDAAIFRTAPAALVEAVTYSATRMQMNSTKKWIGISFATQYTELTIHFFGVLILARILSPEEIGTYSVAAFLMTLLHVFRDFGVVQYLIQERDLNNEKIRSAMGVSIILALTVATVLFASSGLIASFYDNTEIKSILLVMSASFAISPFGSLLLGLFRREMQLKNIFCIKLVSSICHVVVAVSLASAGYGAISLAWANFAGILSFGITANFLRPPNIPWLPRFTRIRTILSFGGIASLGNAANIAGSNIHELVIGKTMSMAAVGYFSRATGLVQLFTRLITSALIPLILPYFAQLRREGKDPVAPYLAAVSQLTVLAWPFFTVLMLLAAPMIRALYGPQWDASVPVAELLCLAGAISSVSLFAAHVMVANGQVRNSTYSQLLTQPFRIIAVIVSAKYGLMQIAITLIASEFLTLLVASWFLQKAVGVGPIELVRSCGKSFLVTLCSAVAPLFIKLFWHGDLGRPWTPLLLGIFGATIGWFGSILLTRHPLAEHFLHLNQAIRKTSIKSSLKLCAYRYGLLGACHRIRNRNNLTVVMFHRILPAADARYAGADPEWTMTPGSFAECLQFFQKHYNIVSPEQVFSALRGEMKLPKCALLVTFDDGWSDTAEYAQPILERFSIQALIFVVGSAVDQKHPFWEEAIYHVLTTVPDGYSKLRAALQHKELRASIPASIEISEKSVKGIIHQLKELNRDAMLDIAHSLIGNVSNLPAMLSATQLQALRASGHTIGGHGLTHHPLTKVITLDIELKEAQERISAHVGKKHIEAMSFPHGAHSGSVVASCLSAGYQFLFSSDARLHPINGNPESAKPIGRIHVSERALMNAAGRFEPALLADWLFLRPVSMNPPGKKVRHG
jgi:O-antigen/teichoic acid export membrane protein/peptidoglycan/xylan/chitin deacetylase (PgdA/CDA1 family)